ncbi:unnamed protein product [Anisakis simplex]|uniref:Enhancer of rudimentary homolog (inferred by orthology to a C. elegans protein) n=1 Tax=Anisakis simplex TaxID=6269 RepID=A0A0M3JA76_ANISI|nr:unnamed protein product [Anisakis simplex]
MSHTILLIQSTTKPKSRCWIDYETLDECFQDIRKMYEDQVKESVKLAMLSSEMNEDIGYDISAVLQFIDRLSDLSVLAAGRYHIA